MKWLVDRSSESSRSDAARDLSTYIGRYSTGEVDGGEIERTCESLLREPCECAGDQVQLRLDWSALQPVVVVEPPARTARIEECQTTRIGCEVRAAVGFDVARPASARIPITADRTSPPRPPEVEPDGSIPQVPFLKALLTQLALRVEETWGPVGVDEAMAQVGSDVGNRIEDEYRRVRQLVERLTSEQMADLFVRLKDAIDGDFYVIQYDDQRIVLGNRSCPFGNEAVRHSPNLCRVTSSVFGGIAARNTGEAKVVLDQRIAVGDPECRVTVFLGPGSSEDSPADLYGSRPDKTVSVAVTARDGGPPGKTTTTSATVASHALEALTPRELEVLSLLAQALGNQAIASRLFISKSAVEKHLQSLFRKLDLDGRDGQDRRVEAALLFEHWRRETAPHAD